MDFPIPQAWIRSSISGKFRLAAITCIYFNIGRARRGGTRRGQSLEWTLKNVPQACTPMSSTERFVSLQDCPLSPRLGTCESFATL